MKQARTSLYRTFDAAGTLLYVGIAENWPGRIKAHKRTAAWFEQVATVTIQQFEDRDEARRAERDAIRTEHPLHNVVYAVTPQKPSVVTQRVHELDLPRWRMADRLARGHLADRILSLRSEGLSWAAITSRLYADHGIEISAVTAADWHDQLAEEKAA